MSTTHTKQFIGPTGGLDFILEITALEEAFVSFNLFQVNSWSGEAPGSPEDTSLYAEGFVKFDGCSHLSFPPSLHLCGAARWKLHCAVMEWVYRELFPMMKGADPSEVWTPNTPN